VAFGGIADAGILANDPELKRRMQERIGDPGMGVAEALSALERLLVDRRPVVAVTRQDWHRLASVLRAMAAPRLSGLVGGVGSGAGEGGEGEEAVAPLAELPIEERREILVERIRQTVSVVMQWPLERISMDRPISEMGLDSLMSMELHAGLERRLGVRVPRTAIDPSGSIAEMATALGRLFGPSDRPDREGVAGSEADRIAALLDRHGATLPPDEIEKIVETSRAAVSEGKRLIP
jgi:acyl carrier protein